MKWSAIAVFPFLLLIAQLCMPRSALAETAYACVRIVKSDPAFPSRPSITLPAGYSLVSYGDYACASEAEYCIFMQGPKGTAAGVRVSWPGVPISAVIWNQSRLAVRSRTAASDEVDCDVPVQAATLRDAWLTFDIHTYLTEADLFMQVEHNDQYRRAGWYADNDWVSGQARASVNYVFASRLIMRDWGIHHRIAAAGAGKISLLGFESWDPLHFDYPPHMHIIMYLPTTGNAGTKVPHFQMDNRGRFYANKVQVLQRPDLGDQYLYVGQPMTYVDSAGRVWMAATIRSDGGMDLGDTATSVAYSMVPDDASNGSVRAVRILKAGLPWARVACDDDTLAGVLTMRTDFADGVTASQSSTSWYDPVTGRPLVNRFPGRAAPSVTSPDQGFATVGSPFAYAVTATSSPTAYAASGLPRGLSIDVATGRIGGTPTTAGEFRVSILASNAAGTGSAPLAIVVSASTGNQAPIITRRMNASPNPTTSSTAAVDVVANDDRGEPALTYAWTASGPGAVSFSRSGTNVAKSAVASFAAAGSYVVTVTVTDAGGLSARSSVNVQADAGVARTMTSITVDPVSATVASGGSQAFTAVARDQNGSPMQVQPTFTWSATGGTITTTGVYAAGSTAGTYTVTAVSGTVHGTATVTIPSTASADFFARVNFQPSSAAPVNGYLVDSGLAFAARGGQSYGWNATCESRERNASSDQRLDTFILMQAAANPSARWEMSVPNGTYQVHVVCGDASYFDGSFNLMVEGVTTVTGRSTSTVPFREGTVTVSVRDGRLTVANGSGSYNTKICYLEIQSVPTGNG